MPVVMFSSGTTTATDKAMDINLAKVTHVFL